MSEGGHSTPRASSKEPHMAGGSSQQRHTPFSPMRFDSFTQPGPSSFSSTTPTHLGTPMGTPTGLNPTSNGRKKEDAQEGLVNRRQMLFRKSRSNENAGIHAGRTRSVSLKHPKIKEDILRMIGQYLGDEGFVATQLVLNDEANFKGKEREERASDSRRLKRAIMDGDWAEVDTILSKPLVRTQKALLYAVYKQQFLEHIEYRELQKAFTLLNKRLKPLEHFQPTPSEFKDMCYLLSAKSVHDAASFKNWEGITSARENLVEAFGKMVEAEREEREESVFVPPGRLLTLLEQAVSYQVETSRYRPKAAPVISSLLQDFSPFVVPNSIVSVYEGHTANVKSASFMGPSGEYIVSGSSDNTVRIWETTTADCKRVFRGHASRVWDVDSNLAADRLASASGDRTIRIWNCSNLEVGSCDQGGYVSALTGNGGDVYAAKWHPMGNHIASGGYDKIVRLYDVESGSVLKTFTGHSLSISSVLFNPLGNLIVSGSKDSHVRFWDSVSGLCVRTLSAQLGEVSSVAMNDVYLLTSSRDNAVRLWDVRMLRPLRRFKSHANTSQNFVRATFAHSSLLVSGSEDGVLYIWDRESSEVLQTLEGHQGVVYGATWNDKQSLLASYGSDGKIRTWEYDERKNFDLE